MRNFVRYFAFFVLGGGVLAAAVAQFAEPFFQEFYKTVGVDTSTWVNPMLTFLQSDIGQALIFLSIGFGLGVLAHWFATRMDRQATPQPLSAEILNLSIPSTDGVAFEKRPNPDPTRVQVIDRLYPLIYELSETHVDQFGDRIGNWREAFTNDLSQDWFAMMNAELRALVARFDEFRGVFSSHRFYDDIYEMDDKIAQRINAIGTTISQVREIAEKVSFKFDARSVDLVDDRMKAVSYAVGQLRSYLSRECLENLAAMRRDASG